MVEGVVEYDNVLAIDEDGDNIFEGPQHVVICEGATERVFFTYLLDNQWQDLRDKQVYFTDCFGKYNIHRFIGLLTALGVNQIELRYNL